mmetsp:Transcript_4992/g.17686  ORF Transcript_4992/g.17686 Transcript_4992/m.17686 type:complete len:81 (+) Transcript_4992:630-872(+)
MQVRTRMPFKWSGGEADLERTMQSLVTGPLRFQELACCNLFHYSSIARTAPKFDMQDRQDQCKLSSAIRVRVTPMYRVIL